MPSASLMATGARIASSTHLGPNFHCPICNPDDFPQVFPEMAKASPQNYQYAVLLAFSSEL
jgi:hypothetical protein